MQLTSEYIIMELTFTHPVTYSKVVTEKIILYILGHFCTVTVEIQDLEVRSANGYEFIVMLLDRI